MLKLRPLGEELFEYEHLVNIMIDTETGVEYFLASMNYGKTLAITPRLNADGTLFVDKKEK